MFNARNIMLLLWQLPALSGSAQQALPLMNPSFEGLPMCCEAPRGWMDCGSYEESPPDIQPGSFLVSLPAADGKTYLGLVVRDNGSSEKVAQILDWKLQQDSTYTFRAALAHSAKFLSISRKSGGEANYTTPVVLKIWGSEGDCLKTELLAVSKPIANTEWQYFEFELTPNAADYSWIILEADFNPALSKFYNGNLLIDDISITKK